MTRVNYQVGFFICQPRISEGALKSENILVSFRLMNIQWHTDDPKELLEVVGKRTNAKVPQLISFLENHERKTRVPKN